MLASISSTRPFAVGLAAVLVSCDPSASPGYLGEPLVTFRGQVMSTGPIDVPLEAAMLWQRGAPPSSSDQELATRAPVQSGFPATFTLHLYQPPPAAALRTLAPDQVTFARANVAAIPYGIATAAITAPPAPGAAGSATSGLDPDHWVMYVASNVPPRSLMEWWLGGPLPAGFHLLRVKSVDPQCMTGAVLDACVADLVQRGVHDDGTADVGTARFYCLQPYRLAVAADDEQLMLKLGATVGPPGACQ